MNNYTQNKNNSTQMNYNSEIVFDSNIYSKESIVAAAHFMIGICSSEIKYLEDFSNSILVKVSSDNKDIESVVDYFKENVINYSFYLESMKNKGRIRELVLERVLKTIEVGSN